MHYTCGKQQDQAVDKADKEQAEDVDMPDKDQAEAVDKADKLHIEPSLSCKKGGWAGQKEFRQAVFLDAFPKLNFNISASAREAHIQPKTFYNWMKADPDFKAGIEALKETKIDIVEDELFKKCREGHIIAILFFLKCKAKHRGYVEQASKSEITILDKPEISKQQRDRIVSAGLKSMLDAPKYNRMLGIDTD